MACPDPTPSVVQAPDVTGRQLGDCDGVTTVDGPWLAVVGAEAANPMTDGNWETAANVAEGRTPERVPDGLVVKGPVPVLGVQLGWDNSGMAGP